jgi:isocitrate/isopropylmalate dehydrogenase
MLEHLGFAFEARAVESAVAAGVRAGLGTPDIGGKLTTEQAGSAVLERLDLSD